MGSIDFSTIIELVDQLDKPVCKDDKLVKATRLLIAASKMSADASHLLNSSSNNNEDLLIKRYAKLASEIAEEISTLSLAATSICMECIEIEKTS